MKMLKTTFKLTVLSAAGIALLAVAPGFAKPTRVPSTQVTASAQHYPAVGVYLLENADSTGSKTSANTNAAEDFQNQFAIDY